MRPRIRGYEVFRGFEVTRFRGFEVSRFRAFEVSRPRFRGFEVSRFRGFEVTRFRGFEAEVSRFRGRGFEVSRLRGFEVSRLRGCEVSRFRGRGFEVSSFRGRGFQAEVSWLPGVEAEVSRFRGRGFEVSRPRFRGFEVSTFSPFSPFSENPLSGLISSDSSNTPQHDLGGSRRSQAFSRFELLAVTFFPALLGMAADYEHGLHCLRGETWSILFLFWCGLTHIGLECCGNGHDLFSEAKQPAYQKAFWHAGEYHSNKGAKWSSEDHICTMPICFHSNVVHNVHTKMQNFDDCQPKGIDLKPGKTMNLAISVVSSFSFLPDPVTSRFNAVHILSSRCLCLRIGALDLTLLMKNSQKLSKCCEPLP